jgi:hypothetical protein
MATGPRQDRIGNTPTGGEQQSAKPGPDFTRQVASAKRQAESAANRRKGEARGLIASPQGSGVGGHEVGTGGSTWDWKSGLAVNEPGG